jgi:hypothetical protein
MANKTNRLPFKQYDFKGVVCGKNKWGKSEYFLLTMKKLVKRSDRLKNLNFG